MAKSNKKSLSKYQTKGEFYMGKDIVKYPTMDFSSIVKKEKRRPPLHDVKISTPVYDSIKKNSIVPKDKLKKGGIVKSKKKK